MPPGVRLTPKSLTKMSTLFDPSLRVFRRRSLHGLSLFAGLFAFTGVVLAQDPNAGNANANGNDARGQRRQQRQEGQANNNGGGRGNFDPAQMQERMNTLLREQFAVIDDAEWTLISARIAAVTELRRNTAQAGFGGLGGLRGGQGGQGGGGGGQGFGGGRGGRGGNASPETDALRQAVVDKLPEAEIKARLARVRETRKANEEKLSKAQEDLRAVLTVRQEAVAVMAGLLP
jgi:hypothetical protein